MEEVTCVYLLSETMSLSTWETTTTHCGNLPEARERPVGVTQMGLERKITGNGTCERLVPDGTWVLPGIAGEREFSGTSLSRLVDVTNIHLSHCEVKSWMFSAAV